LTQDQALSKYVTWLGGSYPGYVREQYFRGSESLPQSAKVASKAKPHLVKELWYNFNFTEEENEFMSSVGSMIHSYISDMEVKFITGVEPMSEWDKYADTVQKMGLQEYMQVYRSAYERYIGKKQ